MSDKNHILNIFKDTGALLEGHFILSSGKHSSKYFQCAKVLQYPEYLIEFSIRISDEFEEAKPDVVISPAIGGVVLGTEVGVQLGCRTIFSERKNGVMVIRRGFNLEPDERVLVIEDVITTGGSVREVMNLVERANAKILGLGVLVDRSDEQAKLHKNQYSIIKIKAESYHEDEVPDELNAIPIQKPGSRYS